MKRQAAVAALDELPPDGVIGIGSGSTARLFIAALGELVAAGRRYSCVPTSEASRTQAAELGMQLLPDDGPWDIAVTVDGADEVDDELNLIKGGGGAHTREKIVNFATRKNVIIVDGSKRSRRLGERWAVPVEVLPFAHLATRAHLSRFGAPAHATSASAAAAGRLSRWIAAGRPSGTRRSSSSPIHTAIASAGKHARSLGSATT